MIHYQLFEAGFCKHCEKMTLKKGRFKQCEYPAICALIKHPQQGYILFDTGYSDRFYSLTQKFPFSLYRYLTPVTIKKSLKDQLLERQINPAEIAYIVISHFHADHIGSLKDFPNARFICHRDALADIKNKKGLQALIQGFLPGLLPSNFYERLIILGNKEVALGEHLAPFFVGYDLFEDGLVFAISLPGHAQGQIGLYFKARKDTFLIADSCWHQETFQELIYPNTLTYLIHHDSRAYQQTIKKLHVLYQHNKNIDLIPSHCKHFREQTQGNTL